MRFTLGTEPLRSFLLPPSSRRRSTPLRRLRRRRRRRTPHEVLLLRLYSTLFPRRCSTHTESNPIPFRSSASTPVPYSTLYTDVLRLYNITDIHPHPRTTILLRNWTSNSMPNLRRAPMSVGSRLQETPPLPHLRKHSRRRRTTHEVLLLRLYSSQASRDVEV
jgi:hypothetical protein